MKEAPVMEDQSEADIRTAIRKVVNDVNRGVVGDVAAPPEPDQAELEERKALAMDSVPELYLDAWARLQVHKPALVSDAGWQQAVDDAGGFSINGASLPPSSVGRRAICSTCRVSTAHAASRGGCGAEPSRRAWP
jgi:hypothetical protein